MTTSGKRADNYRKQAGKPTKGGPAFLGQPGKWTPKQKKRLSKKANQSAKRNIKWHEWI